MVVAGRCHVSLHHQFSHIHYTLVLFISKYLMHLFHLFSFSQKPSYFLSLNTLFPFLKHLTLSFSQSAPVHLSLSLILLVSSHLALSLSFSRSKTQISLLSLRPSLSLILPSAQPGPQQRSKPRSATSLGLISSSSSIQVLSSRARAANPSLTRAQAQT